MKDGEKNENTKKKSKKWIIAVVLIVIAAIALAFYKGIFSLPTGLAVGAQTSTGNQATPQNTQTGTVSSNEVTRNLPYYESMDLQTGRYYLEFSSDTPVWVFVLNEKNFNSWENTGAISFVAAGTGNKDENKVKSFVETFIAAQDEGSKYYILVEGAEKASISYKITRA
jgi:hypothetical protein